MEFYDTIILSDLHLGACNSRTDDILRFLDGVTCDHLIINGDLFDLPHLGKLRDSDLRVLEALREFSRGARVEYLVGNHDPSAQFFRTVLGIDAKEQTTLVIGRRKYLVYHGHGWDRALQLPRWIIAGADGCYRLSQRIDRSQRLARFLKRRCKRYVKAVSNLRDRAIAEAQSRGLGGVVLGHCHVPSDQMIDGIHYLNSGCWTEDPASFVGIRRGQARQEFFRPVGHRAHRVRISPAPP
ncbi:MAG: UDP-2,3-diacylglucosamine diphosphatase, partial [Phycisphaerales bacterium]|nr:UDP-2,3-diacylglucosamine diphosphatase [Phycisphaerales bacterium]